jgi:hypothetical protein
MDIGEIQKSEYKNKDQAPGKAIVIETSEFGGEAVREMEFYQLPGFISSPTKNDVSVNAEIEGGYRLAIASHNYKINVEVKNGETKLYSTDPTGNVKLSEIYLDNTGKIKISNPVEDFKTLINDLIDLISDLETFGSPTSHTVTPAKKVELTALKTRFNLLFKD